ncbi:MAG TPA: hypothetical protein PKD85_20855 [Saprospiraceae bacterium]|nr:hypothetical protein [Saprospiraceae bacterium]
MLQNELVDNLERNIVVQFWDDFMEMLYDEGPFPIKIKIIDVKIEKVIYEGKKFDQLFVYFKNYDVLKVNYENGYYDPMDRYIMREDESTLKFNFADVFVIDFYENLDTIEKISQWRIHL